MFSIILLVVSFSLLSTQWGMIFAATPTPTAGILPVQSVSDLCAFEKDQTKCLSCATGGGFWTAIGCVPIGSPSQLFGSLLTFAIGIAGGIAFVLMLFGALQIMTSAGNPEKLNGGKELVSSAITGLLLIIFSIFILRLVGYNILGIPGFK